MATKLICAFLLAGAISFSARHPAQPHDTIPPTANRYRAILTREAHAAGGLQAPVSLFAAQVHKESTWNDKARSHCGAAGLAQFTSSTAGWIASLYPADLKPGQPYNPAWALRAMVRYDYYLYGKVSGFQDGEQRWAASLSAYNGGLKWLQRDKELAPNCTQWFGCAENVNDGRSAASLKENRAYPARILHELQPLYAAAGWR